MSLAWLPGEPIPHDDHCCIKKEPPKKKKKKRKKRAKKSTNAKKRAILLKADPHCKYCRKFLNAMTATLDHVIPRSRGGHNLITNLVLACAACNVKKGNKLLAEIA